MRGILIKKGNLSTEKAMWTWRQRSVWYVYKSSHAKDGQPTTKSQGRHETSSPSQSSQGPKSDLKPLELWEHKFWLYKLLSLWYFVTAAPEQVTTVSKLCIFRNDWSLNLWMQCFENFSSLLQQQYRHDVLGRGVQKGIWGIIISLRSVSKETWLSQVQEGFVSILTQNRGLWHDSPWQYRSAHGHQNLSSNGNFTNFNCKSLTFLNSSFLIWLRWWLWK